MILKTTQHVKSKASILWLFTLMPTLSLWSHWDEMRDGCPPSLAFLTPSHRALRWQRFRWHQRPQLSHVHQTFCKQKSSCSLNSLSPGKCINKKKKILFNDNFCWCILHIFCEIALRWMLVISSSWFKWWLGAARQQAQPEPMLTQV